MSTLAGIDEIPAEKQKEVAELFQGGLRSDAIHQKTGVPFRYITECYRRYKDEIGEPVSPHHQKLKGVSELVDAEGNTRLKWIKTDADHDAKINQLYQLAESLKEEIPKAEPIKPPTSTNNQLLACHVLSDFHLGMFALLEDWNTKKASQALINYFDRVIENSPNAHTGLFLQLGDFFHANDHKGTTPFSGHVLDIDTAWDDCFKVGIMAMRYGIARMLEKHEHVHVIIAEANHDIDAGIAARLLFDMYYSDEPRVTVDMNKSGYYAYQWGDTGLWAHHGHKRKLADVSKVFASMYPEIFGSTKHRYGHIGHFHHTAAQEDALMQVQIHPTLAAKDAYAVKGGWISQRRSKSILYHKQHGEVGTFSITPEMLI